MKVVSFNVNGIRSRLQQLAAVIDKLAPDIIGLQETKVSDPEFPAADIAALGYESIYHGQKGHYGVALLYKPASLLHCSQTGFPGASPDEQRRLIQGTFGVNNKKLHVINGYFPQGESRHHPAKFPNKRRFYSDLCHHLKANFTSEDNVIVLGDMNVAPEDIDVGIGDENRKRWLRTGKCCFLPEEREWLQSILSLGFTDSFRNLNNEDARYSWFDYRSGGFDKEPKRGLRIDLILASASLASRMVGGGIDLDARAMDKPSDHCPVWLDLSI